jgi:REP element-mobilizing transposase RayT
MKRTPAIQTSFGFVRRGGRRDGAGRRAQFAARMGPQHRRRESCRAGSVFHVTMRMRHDVRASLRTRKLFAAVRGALRAARTAHPDCRIVHFAILGNHLHLIVEAEATEHLYAGMKGFAVRVARAVNRHRSDGKKGQVFAFRYDAVLIRTPRQMHHTLRYVLNNAKKHALERGELIDWQGFDPCSSAAYFDGWAEHCARWAPAPDDDGSPLVVAPRLWLARTGWKKWGLIDIGDVPRRRD